MSNGYFRSKKGFTVVQNDIVRDRKVSMKAKGLYLVIQSYITMPDAVWHKDDFKDMVKEGKKAFESAWSELKDHGYLKVHMYSNGYTWRVEYDLLTVPEPGAHSFYYNIKGELTSTNLDRKRKKEEAEEKSIDMAEENDTNDMDDTAEALSDRSDWQEETCYTQKGDNMPENEPQETCYTQKGGNISESDENTCYPPLGSSHAGSNGRGDNNNKYLIINPLHKYYKDNPSIYHTEVQSKTEEQDRWIDGQAPVILNPDEYISADTTNLVESILYENDGIPKEYTLLNTRMKQIIQVMSGWNDHIVKEEYTDAEQQAYQLVVKALIEMTTERNAKTYGSAKVSYSHVIDQLNIIYRKIGRAENCLYHFIPQVIDRFHKSLKSQRIQNPQHYLKTIIWNTFGTYLIDFDSYFQRTYYKMMEE